MRVLACQEQDPLWCWLAGYHLRSLVTAGGRGEAGVLTDVVTMGEVGRHHRGAVTRLGMVGDRACKHNITTQVKYLKSKFVRVTFVLKHCKDLKVYQNCLTELAPQQMRPQVSW